MSGRWRPEAGGRWGSRAAVAARARALLDAATLAEPSDVEADGPSHVEAGPSDVEGVGRSDLADVPPVDPPDDPSGGAADGPRGVAGGWVPPPLGPFGSGPDPAGAEHRPTAPRHAVDAEPTRAHDREDRWRDRLAQVRLDPGRRGLAAVALVVLVVGAVTVGWLLSTRPGTAAVPPGVVPAAVATTVPATSASARPAAGRSGSSGGSGSMGNSAATPPTGTAAPTVVVDVEGLVVRPGVYRLPAGSRVQDALAAAGGPRPGADVTTLNQARVVGDGEQLAVGVPGAPAAAAAASGSAAAGSAAGGGGGGPVDLNTADVTALDALPGVGPVLAQRIVDWRTEHGRFRSVEDLQQVSGIGPSRFADLRDLVRV